MSSIDLGKVDFSNDVAPVQLMRVGSQDALRMTDNLRALCERLSSHDSYYPGISGWINKKVIPDLRTGKRIAFVGISNQVPVVAAVLKLGARSKFCHLSIGESFQDKRLGHLMFSLMAAETRRVAKEIHFTLPEGLWERERTFFQAFGFESARRASSQYRLFEDELSCSAKFATVWSRVAHQLPTLLTSSALAGYRVNDGVVLSVQKRHAHAVIQGRKTVEIRRRFADRWVGRKASIYASGRTGVLLGTVRIANVTKGSPDEVWDEFNDAIGCTRAEFDSYVAERHHVYALKLIDPEPYEAPISLNQLSTLLGAKLRPPQSYSRHSSRDLWGKALSIAALLGSSSQQSFLAVGAR